MSAYFFFLEFFRKELKRKERDGESVPKKIGEIAKSAGEKWKSMSDVEKKPFVESNEVAKKKYEQEVSSFSRREISCSFGSASFFFEPSSSTTSFAQEVNVKEPRHVMVYG